MRGSCKRGWVGIDADRKRREDRETAGGWVAEEGRGRGGGGGGEKERGEVQILPNRHSHHLLVRGSVHVCRSCYAVLPSLPPSFLLSLLSLSLSLYLRLLNPFLSHPLASLLHPRTITALILSFLACLPICYSPCMSGHTTVNLCV